MSKRKKLIKRINIVPNVNLPLVEQETLKKIQAIGNVTRAVHSVVKKAFTK
jgi:hypothetical protein